MGHNVFKKTRVPENKPSAAQAPEIHTYIQINGACNQKCLFCNRPPENTNKSFVKKETIKKNLDSLLKGKEVKRIIFTGGEPLLHPDLDEFIAYAKKLGFTTEIQTNGTLLDPPRLRTLKRAGLDIINFAFHSHKKEMSDKLRGVDFGFETIIKNIKLADALGFQLHVIHVINSVNYADMPAFVDYVNLMKLKHLRLNLSIVVPDGWAWENRWIIPRMRDIKPYLLEAMKKCVKYGIRFDVSEIVPLCIVEGFEEHAVSTVFKLDNFKIVDDYVTGKRVLDFVNPGPEYALKAPQCEKCSMNAICGGFYPKLPEVYGVSDYVPRRDDPSAIIKKIKPGFDLRSMFGGRSVEMVPRKEARSPKILYMNLDEKCNQNCLFCVVKGANKGKFGAMSEEEAVGTAKKFLAGGGNEIIFTGGEPTLRDDLPRIISELQSCSPSPSLSVITNGVRLSDENFLKRLLAPDKKGLLRFCVSWHSHKEEKSDFLTATPGAFSKTVRGLENLVKSGRKVSVYQVITEQNYKDLPSFAKHLKAAYPAIKDVTFAYPFPQGRAVQNKHIFPRLSRLRPYLIKALEFLEKNGYHTEIATCGQFPLCALPGFEEKVISPLSSSEEDIAGVVGKKVFHEFEMASDDWVRHYKSKAPACRTCVMDGYCQGFWKKYSELFAFDGLKPAGTRNFPSNKVRFVLKTRTQLAKAVSGLSAEKLNLLVLEDFDGLLFSELVSLVRRKKVLLIAVSEKKVIYPA